MEAERNRISNEIASFERNQLLALGPTALAYGATVTDISIAGGFGFGFGFGYGSNYGGLPGFNETPNQRLSRQFSGAFNWGWGEEDSDKSDPKNNSGRFKSSRNNVANSLTGSAAPDPDQDPDKKAKRPDVTARELKKLSKKEIEKLESQGWDHSQKQLGSRADMYKDRMGNVYELQKGGRGAVHETGYSL